MKILSRTNEDFSIGLMSSLQAAKDSPDLHDFELVCEGKTFPCNQFMLKAHSDVFKAMLSHPETKESQTKKVVIEDCTPQVLEIFLQLLYTGQADIPDHCMRYCIFCN